MQGQSHTEHSVSNCVSGIVEKNYEKSSLTIYAVQRINEIQLRVRVPYAYVRSDTCCIPCTNKHRKSSAGHYLQVERRC